MKLKKLRTAYRAARKRPVKHPRLYAAIHIYGSWAWGMMLIFMASGWLSHYVVRSGWYFLFLPYVVFEIVNGVMLGIVVGHLTREIDYRVNYVHVAPLTVDLRFMNPEEHVAIVRSSIMVTEGEGRCERHHIEWVEFRLSREEPPRVVDVSDPKWAKHIEFRVVPVDGAE